MSVKILSTPGHINLKDLNKKSGRRFIAILLCDGENDLMETALN